MAKLRGAGVMASRLPLLLAIAATCEARAWNPEPLSLAIRTKVSEQRVLGKEQPSSFDEHDLVATFGLPWEGKAWASWDASARLLASAGVLRGPGHSTVVVSAVPAIALVERDLRIAVEVGAGLAFLGKHDFPGQDYGGNLQLALTFGVSVPVWRRIGIGYRFMHYSDAGVHGAHTIGADFHTVELSYRFR